MALTEPFDATVVAVAQSAELAMPKRTSLPSMFPPDCKAPAVWSTPCLTKTAPCCSATTHVARSATKMTVIAARTVQPCRVSPTMTPKV
jgi:hypothetical protein